MIKKISIFDVDGTLVNSMHRYRVGANGKIDLPYWLKNDVPEKIEQDTLIQPLAARYQSDLLNPEVFVIIATARACEPGDANYKFISEILGKPNMFVHRKGRSDHRGGAELKINAIKPLLNLKQFKKAVIHVYEDNMDYLADMCHALNGNHLTVGHFNPSQQGF